MADLYNPPATIHPLPLTHCHHHNSKAPQPIVANAFCDYDVALLVCFALVFNSIALPPVLYAQSAPASADQKPAVYLPLIQSATTTVDVTTETPTISLRESAEMVADADRDVTGRALPTPSGAKAAYPLNHLLDGNFQVAGTPPQNHNFEAAAVTVGTPLTNHDFSAASYAVGTPPTNANFETGAFSGWTTAGTVNMQSNTAQGYYGRLQSSGILTSDAFTVDAAAQQVVFEVGYLTTNNYSWFELYALTGPGYATETKIAEDNCSSCGYWVTYGVNIAAYAGQSIKLKFKQRFGSVGIDAVRMRVLLPGYTFPGKITRVDEANGNVYARISKDASVITAAFMVDGSAQSATAAMTGASTVSDQYKIEVLSGPTFATVTQVWLDTSTPDAWYTVQMNLSPWQGQLIKMRVTGLYGAVGVDNIALQQIIAPGWQLTGNPYVRTDTNGNRYLSTNGDVTSAPFTVAPGVQQMSLIWRVPDDVLAAEYLVWLRRGPAFNNQVVMGTLIGGPAGSAGY